MSSQSGLRTRPLLLLALMSGFWQHAHALSQTYCSSQNTGSDSNAVTNIYQSNGACQQQCIDNYAFAVVQYQQCWCTNYAPADQLDVSECSGSCPGYPDESCGNEDKGLYGYIKLNISPSGTQGSGSSSSSPSTSKAASSTVQSTSASSPPSSSAPASSAVQSDSTVYTSVSVTVTVKQSASVIVSYVTASSSNPPTTSSSSTPSSTSTSSPPTSTSISLTSTQAAAVTSSPSSSATDSSSLSHTTFVSTRVVTVSGGPVTQTVTSTAVVAPGADFQKQTEQKGISGGTVAGAVIGSIIGVALLLAGAFFLWRRKRSEASDPESPRSGSGSGSSRRTAKRMERNTSVLSKTGLLSSVGNGADTEKFHDDSTAFAAAHKYSNSEATGPSPVSPDGSNRRNSRPLVYDQRLNPAALMENWERNGSRASIGTMQDQRDYSRPLGVTNPDPVGDD